MGGKWFAALGCRNLCRKGFDRMHSTNQNVAEGLRARLRIIEGLNCGGDCMVRGGGDRVDECHRLLSTVCRRNSRLAVGILLVVPFGERLVIPALTRMEKPSRRLGRRWIDLGFGTGLGIATGVIGRVTPFRYHWHKKSAVGVSYDVHRGTPNVGLLAYSYPSQLRAGEPPATARSVEWCQVLYEDGPVTVTGVPMGVSGQTWAAVAMGISTQPLLWGVP